MNCKRQVLDFEHKVKSILCLIDWRFQCEVVGKVTAHK